MQNSLSKESFTIYPSTQELDSIKEQNRELSDSSSLESFIVLSSDESSEEENELIYENDQRQFFLKKQEEIKARVDEFPVNEKKSAVIETENIKLQEEKKLLSSQVEELRREVYRLNEERASTFKFGDELLRMATQEPEKYKKENQILKRSNTELYNKNKELKQQSDANAVEILKLRDEITALEAKNKILQDSYAKLDNQKHYIEVKYNLQSANMERLYNQIKDLMSGERSLRDANKKLIEGNNILSTDCHTLKQDNDKLVKDLYETRTKIGEAEKTVNDLTAERDLLKDENMAFEVLADEVNTLVCDACAQKVSEVNNLNR